MRNVTMRAVEVTSSNKERKAVVTAAMQTASNNAITLELFTDLN